MDKIVIRPTGEVQSFDEMKFLATVRCKGEPEEGRICYQKLGKFMQYAGTFFVVPRIEAFIFRFESEELLFHRKWKETDYKIMEIEREDIRRFVDFLYLTNLKSFYIQFYFILWTKVKL